MAPEPPSFGSQKYWDARFTSNSNPFEWLEAPTALDPYLVEALRATEEERPEILHIGCGTSLLSYHLRAHVKDPEMITNLDYSDVAIQVGRKREVDLFGPAGNLANGTPTSHSSTNEISDSASETEDKLPGTQNGDSAEFTNSDDPSDSQYMRWASANLLSHTSLLDVCNPNAYSVIVDKSTSDSIACSEDVCVPLPYPVGTISDERPTSRLSQSSEPIHPLHILAIHLALLAKPGARWISLSYSEDRFPFLYPPIHALDQPNTTTAAEGPPGEASPKVSSDQEEASESDDEFDDLDDIPQEFIDSGLPDPSKLWELEAKYEIEVPPPPAPHTNEVVHRPKVLHWVYVLQRTDVGVFVREP